MEPSEQEIQPTGKAVKKERTPAQTEATRKMLQALQEKRRVEWEKKKVEVLGKYKDKIKEVVDEQKPEPPKATKSAIPVTNQSPAVDVEALKSQLRAEVEEELKQKGYKKPKAKKIVVEESSSSESEEEVVIIKKKKETKKVVPKPVKPSKPANPYEALENMFFRQRK
jgi:hypothetical protein